MHHLIVVLPGPFPLKAPRPQLRCEVQPYKPEEGCRVDVCFTVPIFISPGVIRHIRPDLEGVGNERSEEVGRTFGSRFSVDGRKVSLNKLQAVAALKLLLCRLPTAVRPLHAHLFGRPGNGLSALIHSAHIRSTGTRSSATSGDHCAHSSPSFMNIHCVHGYSCTIAQDCCSFCSTCMLSSEMTAGCGRPNLRRSAAPIHDA
jgi:hypothetical protein